MRENPSPDHASVPDNANQERTTMMKRLILAASIMATAAVFGQANAAETISGQHHWSSAVERTSQHATNAFNAFDQMSLPINTEGPHYHGGPKSID
jgi:hypothetical protein